MANSAEVQSKWVTFVPGGQRRVIADGEKLMLLEVKLDAGTVVAKHHHIHEQITYIVKGRVRFTTENGEVELTSGQSILLPSNFPHEVLSLEDTLLTDSFSPPREDFR
jgi:quercetin dioxygenase-like cupin family protein